MPGALPVIVNAAAGKGCGPQDIEILRAAFHAAGAETTIFPARNGVEMLAIAERIVRDGHPVVVAGGGDGTVSSVASMVAGSNTALGILPLGTLNHFARDAGIPLALDAAVRTIVADHRVRVDVGEVNGRTFINNSSLGLYPKMVVMREERRKRFGWSKWRALAWAALALMRRHSMLDVRLCLGELVQHRRTPLVFVGNNEYTIEGFELGRRERLDSGKLAIYLITRHGRRSLLALALRALVGTLRKARYVEALTAQTVGIATRRHKLLVATDGEVTVMHSPLDYRIRPGALQVIVPASQPAAG